ncbi:hypothetical protein PIB30_101930, partial [Stylosanthes scabra]|nr:hypothetical protein [Stylosanthes scabra]
LPRVSDTSDGSSDTWHHGISCCDPHQHRSTRKENGSRAGRIRVRQDAQVVEENGSRAGRGRNAGQQATAVDFSTDPTAQIGSGSGEKPIGVRKLLEARSASD